MWQALSPAAMGRPGWQVPINLVYNSPNWRQDGGTNWELVEDIGYGYEWKILIASLTPYYKGFAEWHRPPRLHRCHGRGISFGSE